MAYKVIFAKIFADSLQKLDKELQKRILDKLDYLALNPDLIRRAKHAPNDLEGLCKYRVGGWRILLFVDHNNKTFICHNIGRRSKVYKKL